MEKEINQLETLLNEINQIIQHRILLKNWSIEDINEAIGVEEEYIKAKERVIARKNDSSFFDIDIPKLKKVLNEILSKLSDINNNQFRDKIGSKLRGPNNDFLKILEHGLLDCKSNIFQKFGKSTYTGCLTNDGYFKLNVNGNNTKLFSSFATAASFISEKPVLKGWEVWFAFDKNKKEQNLEYFRNAACNQ